MESSRTARVRVFSCEDERRPTTVIVDDRAANRGAITDEASFVADLVGRMSRQQLDEDEVAEIVRVRDAERGRFYDREPASDSA